MRYLETLYSRNYPQLIDRICSDLRRWSHLHISLSGRYHLIKMLGFSHLLYPMQTLPILIKLKYVIRVNSAFIKFIRAGKLPRIALRKLMRSRDEGGMNLPNISEYNFACLFRHVMDWIHGADGYSNWILESAFAFPWTLRAFLHTRLSKMPATVRGSILLRDTIATWKEVGDIWGHTESSFENNLPHNPNFQSRGLLTVAHLMHMEEKKWFTSAEALQKYALPSQCHFKTMQILTFCKARLRDLTEEGGNNKFNECLSIQPGHYGLSVLYRILKDVQD